MRFAKRFNGWPRGIPLVMAPGWDGKTQRIVQLNNRDAPRMWITSPATLVCWKRTPNVALAERSFQAYTYQGQTQSSNDIINHAQRIWAKCPVPFAPAIFVSETEKRRGLKQDFRNDSHDDWNTDFEQMHALLCKLFVSQYPARVPDLVTQCIGYA